MTVARVATSRQSLPRQRAKKPQVVPLQKRAIETRRQILLAAAALFRDKGYKATTLRDIARAVGIGAGSFYYYFRSKEEVLHEVLDRGIETVDNMVRGAVNVLPPSASPAHATAAGDSRPPARTARQERLFDGLRAHL
jgi:AcrR family transcriptional regulator